MRRYEWFLIGLLIASGTLCLVTVSGAVWGAGDPSGLFAVLSRWMDGGTPYLMISLGALWIWVVWGLVSIIWRGRLEGVCQRCDRAVKPDWHVCPICGAKLRQTTRIDEHRESRL
jgi:hypothetical protein